ncbi:MAG: hypothetical protein WEA29_01140 [Acidimicrobiia bacterium]
MPGWPSGAALALGDTATAAQAAGEAAAYYEAKGYSAGVERAHRLVGFA